MRERKDPGIIATALITAAESPWFLVKGENLLVRKGALAYFYLLYQMDQGQANRAFELEPSLSEEKNINEGRGPIGYS